MNFVDFLIPLAIVAVAVFIVAIILRPSGIRVVSSNDIDHANFCTNLKIDTDLYERVKSMNSIQNDVLRKDISITFLEFLSSQDFDENKENAENRLIGSLSGKI